MGSFVINPINPSNPTNPKNLSREMRSLFHWDPINLSREMPPCGRGVSLHLKKQQSVGLNMV
jgi:hypothetical protein